MVGSVGGRPASPRPCARVAGRMLASTTRPPRLPAPPVRLTPLPHLEAPMAIPRLAFATLLATACAASLHAAEQDAAPPLEAAEPIPTGDGLFARTGLDPTRVTTSIGGRYQVATNDFNGADGTAEVLKGSYAWNDLSVAATVPALVRVNPGAGSTEHGFGDIGLRGEFAQRVNAQLYGALGLDVTLNTAQEDVLGGNATIIAPFVALSFERNVKERWLLEIHYSTDVAREDGSVPHTRLLEGRLGWLRDLGHGFVAKLEARPSYDDERQHTGLAAFGAISKLIDGHSALSVDILQPIDRDNRHAFGWQFALEYRYNCF
jgi:hypothetical protein